MHARRSHATGHAAGLIDDHLSPGIVGKDAAGTARGERLADALRDLFDLP
jgi:hypothetical protein